MIYSRVVGWAAIGVLFCAAGPVAGDCLIFRAESVPEFYVQRQNFDSADAYRQADIEPRADRL